MTYDELHDLRVQVDKHSSSLNVLAQRCSHLAQRCSHLEDLRATDGRAAVSVHNRIVRLENAQQFGRKQHVTAVSSDETSAAVSSDETLTVLRALAADVHAIARAQGITLDTVGERDTRIAKLDQYCATALSAINRLDEELSNLRTRFNSQAAPLSSASSFISEKVRELSVRVDRAYDRLRALDEGSAGTFTHLKERLDTQDSTLADFRVRLDANIKLRNEMRDEFDALSTNVNALFSRFEAFRNERVNTK